MRVKSLAVLVSGGGSNLQCIIDEIEAGRIPARINLVLSTNSKAYALERAKTHGIPTLVLPRRRFTSVEECDRARHQALAELNPDYIVLAGFLGILLPETVTMFANRILNIHPALIPAFCGHGMHGSSVHQAVLDYGVKLTGATVHFADEGTDTGPILLQEAVRVEQDDTVDSLAARVLQAEHRLLPEAVRLCVTGRVRVEGRKVIIDKGEER